jgi:membrane-bound serine protease (ClpP class)
MKVLIRIILLLVLIGTAATVLADDEGGIFRIRLDDDIINPVSAEYIVQALDTAEEKNAVAIIIELDTPGGLVASTRTIVKRMLAAKIPVVVYVAPDGARAGSAGVFITLAANLAAMAPSTNIGAAHPVSVGQEKDSENSFGEIIKRLISKNQKEIEDEKPEKNKKSKKPGAPMEDKILNDTTAWIKAIASERNRNEAWAVKAVTESVSVTAAEALKEGIIDFIAKDSDELIKILDGMKVTIGDKTLEIKTAGKQITDIEKNFRIKWLALLAHPNIAYILLMLGFYGLIFEFTSPGIGFPGIAGTVAIILAFFGLQVLPTNYAGVALIILGIAMLIAEIRIVSYGLLTLGGVTTLFVGSLILFDTPHDFMRVSMPLVYAFTGATLSIVLFLVFVITRSRRRRPSTGIDGLIDMKGEVVAWNGSEGKVLVHGEIWNAKGTSFFSKGDKVIVKIVDGMTLLVESDQQTDSL